MIVAAVLVKGFGVAKQRLAGALSPEQRRRLAEEGAALALTAAAAADRVLVVAGTEAAGAWASERGVDVIVEALPAGQNGAAAKAVRWALDLGADGVLILSSDLPLITREAVAELLDGVRQRERPMVVAAPATGRGGTNALYLAPPGVIGLHFGDDSLVKFEADALSSGVPFALHESPEFALDLDEPDDLAGLNRSLTA